MKSFIFRQGAEWHELRSKLTPELAGPKIIEYTLKQTSIVADELIDKIRHTRDEDKIIFIDEMGISCSSSLSMVGVK